MTARAPIDVTALLERGRIGTALVGVIFLCLLLMFLDGYDAIGIAFAAPWIARQWHIAPGSFGPAFALGPVGMLIGGIVLGYLGDRFGRKPAIIAATLCFGLPILATPFSRDLDDLAAIRFVSGLGIGGLFPLVLVLAQEFMPRRWRSTGAALANAGYTLGIMFCGVVAASAVPRLGWPLLFWIGGGAAILLCPVLVLKLPESIRFLVISGRDPARIARIARRLDPSLRIDADDRFILAAEPAGLSGLRALRHLFAGRLGVMTPLLWLCYVASSATVFFLSLWGPILSEALGISPSAAALAMSAVSLGGLIASLVLARCIDRFGAIAIAAMPLVAAPLILGLGMVRMSDHVYVVAMLVVGCFAVGGHAGLHAIAGIFYPSACRATGTGWALSVSRLGTIGGPLVGGALMNAHLPLARIFAIAALPSVVFAAAALGLGMQHLRLLREEAAPRASQSRPPAGGVGDILST